jgi:GNAT superfamily N-acetyltransferase
MKPDITCIKMRRGEEGEVFELVKAGFNEYVLPDVTEEGAQEFFRAAREMIYNRPARHFILVAESKSGITGMIDVRDDFHISLFFVKKAFQNRGIGRTLLERAISECFARSPEVSKIEANSSLYSAPIYRKMGFIELNGEQLVSGIRFVPMVKKFSEASLRPIK